MSSPDFLTPVRYVILGALLLGASALHLVGIYLISKWGAGP